MATETLTHVAAPRVAGPKIITPLPGPNAKRILEADHRYISPSYTRSYPLVAKRGRGCIIEDVDGNEFLDFTAGIAVTSTGHCHPEVVAAMQKQSAELIHMSGTDLYYQGMVELAERLSKIAPMKGPHKIYYGNSGAEAVEAALKLARYHTKRQHVIAFLGAFHGRTMGALSLTASKPQQKRRFSPLVPGVTHVRYPDVYHGCVGGAQDADAFALGCARYIEDKLFKTVLAPEEVAASVVEPNHGLGAGIACINLRRQSGLYRRSTGYDGCAGARRDQERRSCGQSHVEAAGRLAETRRSGWRCAWPRADDRGGDRYRQEGAHSRRSRARSGCRSRI